MRIQTKLFLIILCSSSCLVLGMYLTTQWTLDRGLLKYVNTREQSTHDAVVSQLGEAYSRNNSWAFLENNPRMLERLLNRASSSFAPLRAPPRSTDRPPESMMDAPFGPNSRPPPPRHNSRRPPIAVLDQLKSTIVGRYDPKNGNINLLPITRGDGPKDSTDIIGWFAFEAPKHLSDDFDLALAEELKIGFLWISIVTLITSAALALPLSYLLLRRIKTITKATHNITKGDYSIRVDARSRDELGQLAHDFNDLAHTLEANESARKRWIADISHELRTPLSIASGELEAMIDGVRDRTNENLGSAQAEILHLNRLIDDLYQLTNADIGALNYHKEALDLGAILAQEAHIFSIQAQQKGLSLVTHLPDKSPLIWGDLDRIKQLFHNLLTNSMKYTQAPGQIKLSLSINAAMTSLEVEDSAPGVSFEHLSKVFDPLFRVEASRNRQTGGSGLGLGICKQIVIAHNGTIEAVSSHLGGVKIRVDLPLSKPSQRPKKA